MAEPTEKTMRMRTYVLKEIFKTEKDYLDTLKFLSSVFMERLQSREEDENDKLIPEGSVATLLSNVVELKQFHNDLYLSMEAALQPEPSYEHCIGKCFVEHKQRFEVYAPYCTNHERAQKKLNELTENAEFQGFILGCLMLGNYVNDVSMEGFLLTPIQRICKYPLLLRELSKKTPPEHPDYPSVMEALEIMKAVCSNVNETKRQLEQLEKLEELQSTIANWEGANLTDNCTTLIKQGALLKISAGNIQERQFFLFDHLLVYCKKANTLPRLQAAENKDKTATLQKKKSKRKKNAQDQKKWLFKGRISTELMEIESVEDGTSDFHSCGYTVNNGWKILNAAKNKWFVLLAKDKEEKEAWLNEFIMEREKRRSKVSMDQRDTIDVLHSKGRRLYYKATNHNLIKDRKDWLRTHPKALVGSDFVQWLVENKESKSVDEAIMLGQALLDCGILHHVADKHHFKNENVLYRFRYDDGTFKARGESQDLIAKGLRIYARVHCLFQPVVRDKDRNLRSYKQVVEARKLIDWIIEQGDCKGREEVCNLGQSLCENNILHHALDKTDFKDDSSLFKFWPDEESSESSNKLRDLVKKVNQKMDFRCIESYKTKTVLLLNTDPDEPLGFEALYVDHHNAVIITAIIRASQAQVQGLLPGQAILCINYSPLFKCKSQEDYEAILKQNLENHKLLYVTVKAEDDISVSIPVTREGMGFQIRSANPCVVHAVTKGGMAMNAGLVRGQSILKVNNVNVIASSHDEVAAAIRDGCKVIAEEEENRKNKEEKENNAEIEEQQQQQVDGSTGKLTLGIPGSGLKRSKSDRRKQIAMKIGIRTPNLKDNKIEPTPLGPDKKDDPYALKLVVGNRHLERMTTYEYDNVNGVRTSVTEKMSESPSIFDLAAMLLEVLTAEDERVLADVQALESAVNLIREQQREIFERRRTLRYDVIHERLENYKRYKRHLGSYMWPSYKESKDRPGTGSAKDFCPTNCHINIMQVSHTTEKFNLRGLGLQNAKSEAENTEITKNVEMVNTNDVITCMAAPSHRSRGREGHGLMAVLRGVEGNMELMDQIRQLMVALDQAMLEVRHCQDQLLEILNSEPRTDGKRNSFQPTPLYANIGSVSSDMTPTTPVSPSTFFASDKASSPPRERMSGVFDTQSNRSSRASDFDPSSNRTSVLSPTIEVNTPDMTTPTAEEHLTNGNNIGNKRKSILDDGSQAGNDSECDSGIHSNRGSMLVNDKQLIFNFTTPSANESPSNTAEQNGSNSGSSTTSEPNQRMSLALPEDSLANGDGSKGIKESSSMPSLSSPPTPGGNATSPVRFRSKPRPHSRVTFSGRDRISVISKTESTCSSEGVESINFIDLVLSNDALDKLQGTMEHFLGKIRNINELVRNDVVQKVFGETQDITPEVKYQEIIDNLAAETSDDIVKMSLAVCEDTVQFAGVIHTLIDAMNKHISQIRTQLVLTVLLNEDPKLVSRRDKVFSQALISVITSFSSQLRCALDNVFNNMKAYGVRGDEASKKWLEQATSIGVLVLFQTHLNLNMPDECAMLEDSYVGIYDLERVSFHFRAITGEVEPNVNGIGYTMEGNRSALKVNFHLDKHIFIKLPPRLQAGGGVKIVPVMFNHGLEDVGSFLYKQGVTLHEFLNSLNEKALEKTYDYYKKFRAFHLDRSKLPRDTEARAVMIDRLSRPLNALDEVMQLIEAHVKPRANSPNLSNTGCGVLSLSAEFCHRLGGCHIMSCNNGVYRSTTACSLQQAMILARCHGLPPRYLSTANHLFTHAGARSINPRKNPHTRDTTVKSAPRLYRTAENPEDILITRDKKGSKLGDE
uniref:phosphatidylinositol 3,4,5-trisphosphate-dependent Rac exchanger 2 protein-like isoform X2 n=1 Tax=Styela clava TaxID=7725 RepID=UPI0019396E46|nr:phosphatidylinositol 3,4,5-trisphosphate-dependent Rac exchanger 2 protein-like isoform X2 [Styela clava]